MADVSLDDLQPWVVGDVPETLVAVKEGIEDPHPVVAIQELAYQV